MSLQHNSFRNLISFMLFLLFTSFEIYGQGELIGPVYPPPLGSTRTVSGAANAIGKESGITWTLGSVDLVAYDEVYWGPENQQIKLSMDNNSYASNEIMKYDAVKSDLGAGIMVFSGTTRAWSYYSYEYYTVYTRCVIKVTRTSGSALPLIDASTLGLPDDIGAVGSLRDWGIDENGYFKVNIKLQASRYQDASDYSPAFDYFDNAYRSGQVFSSVDCAFYYENSPPVVVTNNTITMQEGQRVTIPQSFLNSQDVESNLDQITYTVGPSSTGRQPAHGLLRLNNVAIGLGARFTQEDIFENRVSYEHNGDTSTGDDFTFTISDGQGATVPASGGTPFVFNIEITQINHPPVAQNSTGSATVGTNFYGQFQATDSDLPAQQLTYTLIQNGKKGTAELLSFNDGSFSYTPDDAASGLDTLLFQVSDGVDNAPSPGRFIITVINNQAPVITAIEDQIIEENKVRNILIQSSDPDGHHITLTVNNLPPFADFSSTGNGNGVIQIFPQIGDIGDYPGIEIIARDDGAPVRSAREVFSVTVIAEIKPEISISPSMVFNFDTLFTDADSQIIFTIYNLGNITLIIDNINLTGNDSDQFEIGSVALPLEIDAGDSVGISVYFKPTTPGYKMVMLVIDSNDPVNDPLQVELRGQGIRAPSDVLYHLGDLKAPPGVVVSYPVEIELVEIPELCAFGFNVIFNSDILAYQDWHRGVVIPGDGFYSDAVLINDSTLNISGFRKYGSSLSQNGEIALIDFLVNSNAPLGPTPIKIVLPNAGNCQGLDLVTNAYDVGRIIIDIYALLSGRIYYFDPLLPQTGRPVANIPVYLNDTAGNIVDQTVTDENGFYTIDSVLTLHDYILTPKIVDDELNLHRTVNSTDAYRAYSAANSSIPFANPFQFEVADVNNNNSFNNTDVEIIFKLASYQIPNLRSYGLDDWNFVPVQKLNLAKCPVNYPNDIRLNNLLRDTDELDFMCGINGDVNGTGNELVDMPKVPANPVQFDIANAVVFDEYLRVPINIITNNQNVYALQFEISYNDKQLEYTGYLPTDLTPDKKNWMISLETTPDMHVCGAAFVMNDELALNGTGALVYLNFKIKGESTGTIETSINFTHEPVAGDRDGYALPVQWQDGILSIEEAALPTHPILTQNYPNPFNPGTNIEFILPEHQMAELSNLQ